MAFSQSAVHGSSLPESVCGKDERVRVQPMTSPPYKWICSLSIESSDGDSYRGTGFRINLPGVNRPAIVTSGHCTFVRGAYASNITVAFPGQAEIEVGSDDLYAAPEYRSEGSKDHDYGLILLPECGQACNDGFGWSAIVEDEELNGRLLTNCGYPGDKPDGTMWITGGKISSYTASRIFYMNDTMVGQSGSPVYTWYGGYWTVLAVQSYGGCPNSAPRFTSEMITRFLQFMNCFKSKSLRSVAFPDVYIRCDGSSVTKFHSKGGGTVNCQYKAGSYEKFYIYPVEVPPSLALEGAYKVLIQSTKFNNVFIRLNGKNMHQTDPSGGGEVNCQFSAKAFERFFLKEEENGNHSLRSVQFPHCYIRLDGSGVTHSITSSGGGTVNCQWYETGPPRSYEVFIIEEH